MPPPARARVGGLRSALFIGLTSMAGFGAIEGVARVVEKAAAPFDFFGVRNGLRADAATGEPTPSFFVSEGTDLVIRSLYTSGKRCYPFHCQSIPARKSASDYWIACFGGSTTNGLDLIPEGRLGSGLDLRRQGWPAGRPFCERVRERVQALLPHRRVRTLNAGGDAFDSEKLLPIAREVARRIPSDLWIIYMGHNEFIHTREMIEPVDGQGRAALAVLLQDRLAVYRGLSLLYRRAAPGGRVRGYSPRIFMKSPSYDALYRQVLESYDARLREFVALGRASGAAVLLSELVSNHSWLDESDERVFTCFRHGITPEEIERLRHAYAEARGLEQEGRYREALDAYRRVEALDDSYAPAAVGIAACLARTGDRVQALRYSRRAKALNPFPPVVTPVATEVLRRVARETAAPLAETIATYDDIFLDDALRYARLFSDDCHPTDEGHRLLADRMIEVLERQLLAPRAPAP